MSKKKIIILGLIAITIGVSAALYLLRNQTGLITPQPSSSLNRAKNSHLGRLDFNLPSVEIKKILGDPNTEYTTGDQTLLEYKSEYEAFPDQIYLENNKLSLVKEQITPSDERFGSKIIDLLPFPQSKEAFTRVFEEYGDSSLLFIYPQDGVAFIAHVREGTVSEIWHFNPISIENIDQTWGNNLMTIEEFREQDGY